MPVSKASFQVECEDDVVIVTPQQDLGEFDYDQLATDAREAIDLLDKEQITHLVIDFEKCDYFGSSTLGLLAKLWKKVSAIQGQMVFANVSPHIQDVLNVTRLDSLWPIYSSRAAAVEAARSSAGERTGTERVSK